MISDKHKDRLRQLSGVIQEDRKRIDFLKNRFVSKYKSQASRKAAENVFKQIAASDPSKNKQYVQWLLNLYDNGKLKLEDLYKATEYLHFFDALKRKNLVPSDKKDIGQIRSLLELFELISELGGTGEIKDDESYLVDDRFFINNGQVELLFENDKWLVVSPVTYDASKFYACTTQWCTKNPDQFDNYSSQGQLIIAIDKSKLNTNLASRRFQIHFESDQFMDFKDSPVNINKLLKENPDLAVAMSSAIRNAVMSGYHVLHPDEGETVSDDEKNNLSYDVLPDDVKAVIRRSNIEKGWVVHPAWVRDMTPAEREVYINNRLRKNGAKYIKADLFSMMTNKQKAYYFKRAVATNERVPKEIIDIADPKFVAFYLADIAGAKGLVDNYIYDLMDKNLKKKYLERLTGMGITLIPQKQVADMSDEQVKRIIDKMFKKYIIIDDGFFKGMSDNVKNYYISKVYNKFGEKNAQEYLTKHQMNWGRTYGFLS
jgi:hypothetical protein